MLTDHHPRWRGLPFRSAAIAILSTVLAACGQPPEGSAPGTWPDGPVVHEFGPDYGAQPPGPLIRLDSGRLSDDGTVITVTFVAGKPFDPANPCAREDIQAWVGSDAGGGLGVAVGSFTVPGAATFPPEGSGGIVIGCSMEGWTHEARLHLASPYTGRTVRDLAANRILWIDRPEPHIMPGDLPDGWVSEQDFSTGWDTPAVWTSVFAAPEVNPDFGWGDPGHLVLRQGLDGVPAAVLDVALPSERVTVAGRAGILRRDPVNGQLELAWTFDGVPLLLTGYEQDLSREAFLAFAAAMRLDDETRPGATPSGDSSPAFPSLQPPVITPVPGATDDRSDGSILLGGVEIAVDPEASAEPAISEDVARSTVMEALSRGEAQVLGTHEDSPALSLVATGFVPGLVRIIGPAGGTDFEPAAPVDAWVVTAEGMGSDGRYMGVGVVGQDGELLTLYVISPGVG